MIDLLQSIVAWILAYRFELMGLLAVYLLGRIAIEIELSRQSTAKVIELLDHIAIRLRDGPDLESHLSHISQQVERLRPRAPADHWRD